MITTDRKCFRPTFSGSSAERVNNDLINSLLVWNLDPLTPQSPGLLPMGLTAAGVSDPLCAWILI